MAITVKARANCDQVLVAWKSDAFIDNCRGFALARERRSNGGSTQSDYVQSWVGFKGEAHQPGEHEPSSKWPIQRYSWSDLLVSPGDECRYRIVPMLRAKAGAPLMAAPASQQSDWSPWVKVGTGDHVEAYFNRGIVPGQFIARQQLANFKNALDGDIKKPGSPNRDFLSGVLRPALLGLLKAAAADGQTHIYAALYELNDPELIAALTALGERCHLILANGAFKNTGDDENADVRKALRREVDLHDRLVPKGHFAHNKFVVFSDGADDPRTVWTGSTNWTVTGLCTQVNNGIHVRSPDLAREYKTRWQQIKSAGNDYPAPLAKAGSTAQRATLNGVALKAWNVPCNKLVDLDDAKQYIRAAKDGVLFLTFNPGPKGTLLNEILALDSTKLLIHGVANQDPGGNKAPVLKLVQRGKGLPPVALDEVLPTALQDLDRKWFLKENRFAMVMIHSKVIVIDPFGDKPVVMTGSHNLGPKASAKNDDNLLIIENAPQLAAEYAVNIAFVFAHYKWRYNQWLRAQAAANAAKRGKAAQLSSSFDGINDDDQWQRWYAAADRVLETNFWTK